MSDLKSNIRKIYLFEFFLGLHFIGAVLVPFFTQWGGLSFARILLLQSWFMFWIFALEVPTGTLADYAGRKTTMLLSVAIHIIAALVYVSTPSFYVFLLAEFLWALAFAFASGAKEAFVYDTLVSTGDEKESKKVFGRLETVKLAGIMVGSPMGSLIAKAYGVTAPMLFLVVPFSIALLIGLTLREPKMTKETEKKNYMKILKEGLSFFYGHKVLRVLAMDTISISTTAYFVIWLFQSMLQQSGVDIAYFGLVHAAFVAAQIAIINGQLRLEAILGSKRMLLFLSAFVLGLSFLAAGLFMTLPVVLLAVVVGGGFGLARRPLFLSYMNKHIPSERRATVLSAISMFRTLAIAIVNPFVGMLLDWSLRYTLIILGSAAIVFSFLSKVEEDHLID